MGRVPRICVVGSANVDLTIRTPRMPKPGETLAGRSLHVGQGGKGANQAVAAARLGANVAFVARIGADTFGHEAIHRYQHEGIDTSFVVQDNDQPTGTAAILVDDAAENCILIVAGANARLSSEDVRAAAAVIRAADAVLCQLETPLDATLETFRIARAAGVRTILTPAPAVELSDELLRLCDICIPNTTELELLTCRKVESIADVEATAHRLLGRGIGIVVVTMGAQGALVLDRAGTTHIPALNVDAVDPTGAGDAFTAVLAVSLGEGKTLRDAARLASVVAALTVTRIGTQAAFPTRAEVEQWSALKVPTPR